LTEPTKTSNQATHDYRSTKMEQALDKLYLLHNDCTSTRRSSYPTECTAGHSCDWV